MARIPQVTRTIKATRCVCLGVDTEKGEVKEIEVCVSRTHKPDKLLKEVQRIADTDTVKIVSVKESEVVEQLYGMSEEDFIKVAKPLESRNAKKEAK